MLQVNSETLLAGGLGVTGVTAQQGAATAAAMPVVSGLVPSGIDSVSMLASTAFSAQGVDFSATSAEGTAMLGLAAEGMTTVAAAYEAVDAAGAVTVL